MAEDEPNTGKDVLGRLFGWMEKEGLPTAADLLGQQDWVEKYVRRTISQAIPPAVTPLFGAGEQTPEVFDTHHFVIVKCRLPKRIKENQLRLYVRPDRIKLDGWPDEPKIVKLPVAVDPYECRALCREGVLQIKLRKRPIDRMYHEVDIRFS